MAGDGHAGGEPPVIQTEKLLSLADLYGEGALSARLHRYTNGSAWPCDAAFQIGGGWSLGRVVSKYTQGLMSDGRNVGITALYVTSR